MLWAYYAPPQFQFVVSEPDAGYRWRTELVAHPFRPRCGCTTYSDTPDFKPDGSADKVRRRIGVNARLFGEYAAAAQKVAVIDSKNMW